VKFSLVFFLGLTYTIDTHEIHYGLTPLLRTNKGIFGKQTRPVFLSIPTTQEHRAESLSGLLSAAPRSLGIASPYDLFSSDDLRHAIKEARENLGTYASAFANGNDDLAKGITTQHRLMLDALEAGSGGPVELNLGKTFISLPRLFTELLT